MTNPINYNPNSPEVETTWADWQIQFIQNFTQLATAFSQNHVPLDDATVANRGNHTYVQMPELTSAPQTGASEFSIHSLNVEEQTDQIYFTYPGNTPVVQFTNYQLYTVKNRTNPNQISYFTFLPGKLIVYFGHFGPFSPQQATLYLDPPVCKNIIALNYCFTGPTPQYTTGANIFASGIGPGLGEGIIKYIFIGSPFKSPNSIDYVVVGNI